MSQIAHMYVGDSGEVGQLMLPERRVTKGARQQQEVRLLTYGWFPASSFSRICASSSEKFLGLIIFPEGSA